VQVHLRDAAVKVFTQRGNDWINRFRKIAADAWHVSAGSAIIDGEVVVPAENGITDFSVLQNELKGRSKKIALVAFDLLYLNSHDLRKLPLVERKALLKKLVADTDVQFSESFEVDGQEMYQHACKVGLEGVVSKVRDGRYQSGRSSDWVKKACAQRETLPIAGFALKESKLDGIYLGRHQDKALIYAGKVDHGFDAASAKDLQARLKPLIRNTQLTPKTSRIAASGSSRHCWQKSSTAANRLRAESGIRFSRASGRTSDELTHRFKELAPERRPQHPHLDGTGLRFETLDHGGEYPDTMPRAIKLIDAEGRSCIYVPITQDGKVVDSQGYALELDGD
jgi:bifunctional non-homologous end joining protein LigD